MKKSLFIAVCALFCCTNAVFAQFANTKSNSSLSTGGSSTEWQGFRFSYGFSSVKVEVEEDDDSGSESGSFSELTLAYSKGLSISETAPVFLELAPELSLLTGSDKKITGDKDNSLTALSVGLPVNVGYKFDVSNNIAIKPYIGAKAKFNIIEKLSNDDHSQSLFDDDLGGKRFQLGWQIGVGVDVNTFHIGLAYHADILPMVKYEEDDYYDDLTEKWSNSSVRLTIGLNF